MLNFFSKINHNKRYAYYAFPALLGLLVTFVITRWIVGIFPSLALVINGVHVHHFIHGISILIIVGYLLLFLKSWGKKRYLLALAYGSGIGFILDEFYFLLHLDASPFFYQFYDAVVVGATAFGILMLLPWGFHGLGRLFDIIKNHENPSE